MTLSGIAAMTSKHVIDGMFIILIGTFGWLATKADTRVANLEKRTQIVEQADVQRETEIIFMSRTLEEVRLDVKKLLARENIQ